MSLGIYPVGIIGGGAWGTALAAVMAQVHDHVLLWAREKDVVRSVNARHENVIFLPGTALSTRIEATADLTRMEECGALLVVTPAQHVRTTLAALPDTQAPLILCAKGIEADTQMLVSDIAAQVRPRNPLAVLSGPTFAHEVAAGQPTAVTLAAANQALGSVLMRAIATPSFRTYWSDDVVGAEIGGAVKNVLAIACGVVDGAGLGLNARAALIARGFAEMQRYGLARGAKAETLAGLSGLGGKFAQLFLGPWTWASASRGKLAGRQKNRCRRCFYSASAFEVGNGFRRRNANRLSRLRVVDERGHGRCGYCRITCPSTQVRKLVTAGQIR
jgi:glycerol-3-phosphate dehydrogenase (NAD(P)+)